MDYILHGYWRSSATYRVRIALNLKGIEYQYVPVHLVADGGQQYSDAYSLLNPSHLVPTLVNQADDVILNQSMSIVEYLDDRHPDTVKLLPTHALEKARVRGLAQDIACDMQPLMNLRVLNKLKSTYGVDDDAVKAWAQDWIGRGFAGVEKRLKTLSGKYCFDFDVTIADVCLIPQVYNALRFGVNMNEFPLISKIYDNCMALPAFEKAKPENQIDAP